MDNRKLLTKREWDVVRLVGQGLSNEQIATRLVITVWTVERHLHHLFEKLEATTRFEAAFKAGVIIYVGQEEDLQGKEQPWVTLAQAPHHPEKNT